MKILFFIFYFIYFIISIEKKNFTISQPKGPYFFFESFEDNSKNKWIVSKDPKYKGQWKIDKPEPIVSKNGNITKFKGDFDLDKGLIMTSTSNYFAIGSFFEKTLNVTNKDLIIQYEVRFQHYINCGGAYLKLFSKSNKLNFHYLNGKTPYIIMFGPDKCGPNNSVQFIFKHQNPITKKFEEKKLKNPPTAKTDKFPHLYTLYIRKNNIFSIYIDLENVRNGSLLEDFEPPVNPSTTIDDPNDPKPKDWVDDEMIPDPNVKKPDDWDENEPPTIIDKNDKKPKDWLDNEPLEIVDLKAKKPKNWNEKIKGPWKRPKIPNPKCKNKHCGLWLPKRIPNPKYKGPWKPPMIKNPKYKGPWKAKQIANPNYFEDNHPHNFALMGGIGFELWSITDGIMFDNILITHDFKVAKKYAKDVWLKKFKEIEKLYNNEDPKEVKKESYYTPLSAYYNFIITFPLISLLTLIAILSIPISLYIFYQIIKSEISKNNKLKEKSNQNNLNNNNKENKNDEIQKENNIILLNQKENLKTNSITTIRKRQSKIKEKF